MRWPLTSSKTFARRGIPSERADVADRNRASKEAGRISLVVRRTIKAPAWRVFEAWTRGEHLQSWWGPRPITCPDASVDLRVGGTYRIANRFPDGTIAWIVGEYKIVDPPRKLVYTWSMDSEAWAPQLVTVRFEARDAATEVIIVHEYLSDVTTRDQHEQGWIGCLDGLERYIAG
jgi:uncharacterized protein YndB with AHSA1/START domain